VFFWENAAVLLEELNECLLISITELDCGMKTKSLFSAAIIWLLISTFSFLFYSLAYAQDTSNVINYIQVSIQSPQNNTSYAESNTLLNGSIEFSVHEENLHSADSLSQEFSANYSLDDGEWKSLPFSSFTSKEEFSDPIIGGYWNTLEGKYSTVLQGLSEGPHSVRVTVNPHIYWWINIPAVYFTINASAPASGVLLYVVIIVVVLAVVTVGGFLAFRRRKGRGNPPPLPRVQCLACQSLVLSSSLRSVR
jgi:hypothetical protein